MAGVKQTVAGEIVSVSLQRSSLLMERNTRPRCIARIGIDRRPIQVAQNRIRDIQPTIVPNHRLIDVGQHAVGTFHIDRLAVEPQHHVDPVLLAEIVGGLPDFLVHGMVDFSLALQKLVLLQLHLHGQIGLPLGQVFFQLFVVGRSLAELVQPFGKLADRLAFGFNLGLSPFDVGPSCLPSSP